MPAGSLFFPLLSLLHLLQCCSSEILQPKHEQQVCGASDTMIISENTFFPITKGLPNDFISW